MEIFHSTYERMWNKWGPTASSRRLRFESQRKGKKREHSKKKNILEGGGTITQLLGKQPEGPLCKKNTERKKEPKQKVGVVTKGGEKGASRRCGCLNFLKGEPEKRFKVKPCRGGEKVKKKRLGQKKIKKKKGGREWVISKTQRSS